MVALWLGWTCVMSLPHIAKQLAKILLFLNVFYKITCTCTSSSIKIIQLNLFEVNPTKIEWAIFNARRQLSEVQQRGVLHQFYPSQLFSCYKSYMGTCRIIRRVFPFLFEVKIIKTKGVIFKLHSKRANFLTLSILRMFL